MINRTLFIIIIIILFSIAILIHISNYQTINKISSDEDTIYIDDILFNKYVDIITDYSIKTQDQEQKYLYVYLSSFSIFNLNYDQDLLTKIDLKLSPQSMYRQTIHYPKWSKFNNIQALIVNHITYNIYESERYLSDDWDKNRGIIVIYLNNLFGDLGVVRI